MKLKRWIEEKAWADWDRQIAADSTAGKLDFLKREVLQAKTEGKLREL